MPTKLPDIMPSSDLLKQVDGIESGLRNRQRARGLGWVIIGAVQFAYLVYNGYASPLATELRTFDLQTLPQIGIVFLPLFVLGLIWLFLSWNAFWLKASEAPFRYTYWVDAFEPLSDKTDERLGQLHYDLSERLSHRIGRLSRASQKGEAKRPTRKKETTQSKVKDQPADKAVRDTQVEAAQSNGDSHIHIRGYYVLRDTTEGSWQIEVTAWVAVGPPGSPESKAHLIKFPLRCDEADRSSAPSFDKPCADFAPLDAVQYDQLVERVYFSIATQIYNQIRDDVDKKIALLPTRHFKATAYLHEANDYARSNTLDAYDAARDLYLASMRQYRRAWQPLPTSRLPHSGQVILRGFGWAASCLRRWMTQIAPGVGQIEVLAARAELGYTKMLLYRRVLAALSGRRMNPVFEAWPIAEDAVNRLKAVNKDVPHQAECLFDAYVAAALALVSLGDYDRAWSQLAEARRLLPNRVDQDPGYLFVSGCIEADLRTALLAFLRAVELDPQFEVAQFQLAATWDKLWRRAPTRNFEVDVAEIVTHQYMQVLKLNPGNVAAWQALGYVEWLQGGEDDAGLEHLRRAEMFYQRGREYKEIKPDTFVADLDQGLARIAAERGEISKAYQHYMESVTSYFAVGFSFVPRVASPRPLEFQFIGEPMITRFQRYRAAAEQKLRCPTTGTNGAPTDRVRDCLRAFVWNDFAEACYAHFTRAGDPRSWLLARAYFQQASELNKQHENRYVLPDYNLHRMYLLAAQTDNPDELAEFELAKFGLDGLAANTPDEPLLEQARQRIRAVRDIEQEWLDGKLAFCAVHAEWVPKARRAIARLKRCQEDLLRQAKPEDETAARSVTGDVGTLRDDLRGTFVDPGQYPAIGARQLIQLGATPERINAPATLQHKAEAVGDRIRVLEQDIRASRAEVTELVQGLLPHRWLWHVKNNVPTDLRWGRVSKLGRKPRDRFMQLQWERNLDDAQVEALFTWAMCENGRLKYLEEFAGAPPAGHDRLSREELERLGLAHSERLFQHIERYFWPDNLQLLFKRRDLPGFQGDKDVNHRIRNILERDRGGDPLNFFALSNLARDPAFNQDSRRVEHLRAAAQEPYLSAFVYQLIGDSLKQKSPPPLPTPSAPTKPSDSAGAKANGHVDRNGWRSLLRMPRATAALPAPFEQEESSAPVSDEHAHAAALAAYQRSLDAQDSEVFSSVEQELAAELRAPRNQARRELAIALWGLHEHEQAVAALERIHSEAGLPPGWLDAMVTEMLADHGHTSGQQQLLTSVARRARACLQRGDRVAARDARRAIWRILSSGGLTAEESDQSQAVFVRPIVLYADVQLFPQRRDTPEVVQMLNDKIPEIQRDIFERRGVSMPYVLIHAFEPPVAGTYMIALHEVKRATGQVYKNKLFCLDPAECQRLQLTGPTGHNPRDGSPGIWVDSEKRSVIEQARVPFMDAYTYMLSDLQAVVENHLESMLGLNELADLLRNYVDVASNDPDALRSRQKEVEDLFADSSAAVQLVKILREIVQDGISIHDLDTIMHRFLQARGRFGADTFAIGEALRSALTVDVVRAATGRARLRLPPDIEAELGSASQTDSGVIGLTQAQRTCAERLVGAIRETIGTECVRKFVIVVAEPRTRRVVRRMLAREFRGLPVFSEHELQAESSWFEREVTSAAH